MVQLAIYSKFVKRMLYRGGKIQKKKSSLLTLEYRESDKYKCWVNLESKVQILVNIYGTIKTLNFQLLYFLVLD